MARVGGRRLQAVTPPELINILEPLVQPDSSP